MTKCIVQAVWGLYHLSLVFIFSNFCVPSGPFGSLLSVRSVTFADDLSCIPSDPATTSCNLIGQKLFSSPHRLQAIFMI